MKLQVNMMREGFYKKKMLNNIGIWLKISLIMKFSE